MSIYRIRFRCLLLVLIITTIIIGSFLVSISAQNQQNIAPISIISSLNINENNIRINQGEIEKSQHHQPTNNKPDSLPPVSPQPHNTASKFELWYKNWINNNKYINNHPSPFINSGTPHGVTNSFDCSVRFFAWNYGKFIQPHRGANKHLFDALQLAACNITIHTDNILQTENDSNPHFKHYHSDSNTYACTFYIDPINGNDSSVGSLTYPFYTILRGIIASRQYRVANNNSFKQCVILLMGGTFYLNDTILLTEKDSFLTFKNYKHHKPVISGGIKLEFVTDWKLYQFQKPQWVQHLHTNNVYNRKIEHDETTLLGKLVYLGRTTSFNDCISAAKQYNIRSNSIAIHSITWFDFAARHSHKLFKAKQCFGVPDISWSPYKTTNTHSARIEGRNIWYIKVANHEKLLDGAIYGLRLNKSRLIRARYPNQNAEIAMQFDVLSGWMAQTEKKPTQRKWISPNISDAFFDATDVIIDAADYPDVEWPMHSPTDDPLKTIHLWRHKLNGEGDSGQFVVGKGGPCRDYAPDFGYWCAKKPPRSHRHFISQHKYPSGMRLNEEKVYLPGLSNGAYDNNTLQDAVIHVWHPKHWFTWMFDVKSFDTDTNILSFDRGGHQGAEGEYWGGEYYIENVFEELDSPNEYFYNQSSNVLYFYHNHSEPFQSDTFAATNLKVLFNMTRVRNVTFEGIEFCDTAYTFMDVHGLPSSGDWALSKKAAVSVKESENVLIRHCLFTRLDGNAIMLLGYNRNCVIEYNSFEWIGESCICLWGETTGFDHVIPGGGPDGRTGTQPRFTIIQYNQFREIGIFQKQASCETTFKFNIFYNGPRAAININDGFGGKNEIFGNLIFNVCRESGDHGPFNAWDRLPYITRVRNGTSSIIPAFNQIHNNLWIGTYQTQEAVDTDDGASYYNVTDNFFVYGRGALKGDFGGHDVYHLNNVYAYIEKALVFCCNAGANDMLTANELILLDDDGYDPCDIPVGGIDMKVYNNNIYLPTKTAQTLFVCNSDDGKEKIIFKEWQQKGNDQYTTINRYPSDVEIVKMAIDKLNLSI